MDTSPYALPYDTQLQDGAYIIAAPLAQGGFGILYAAYDQSLDRMVAIKELFLEGSTRSGLEVQPPGSATDYERARARFQTEAAVIARLKHPNIVNVHACFAANNTVYMVMEYLAGKTLYQLTDAEGWLQSHIAVDIIQQIGEALQVVHGAGVIHRDINPNNIIICDDGRAVAIDFGLNYKIEEAQNHATRPLVMTTRFGTGGFAPIEQYGAQGQLGTFTDIYALGATLYFALTGTAPTEAPDRAQGRELQPPSLLRAEIDATIDSAVMWALEMEPGKRPQTVEAFLHALEPASDQPAAQPIPRAKTKPVAAAESANPDAPRGSAAPLQPSTGTILSWASLPLALLVLLLPAHFHLEGAFVTAGLALAAWSMLGRFAWPWLSGLVASTAVSLNALGFLGVPAAIAPGPGSSVKPVVQVQKVSAVKPAVAVKSPVIPTSVSKQARTSKQSATHREEQFSQHDLSGGVWTPQEVAPTSHRIVIVHPKQKEVGEHPYHSEVPPPVVKRRDRGDRHHSSGGGTNASHSSGEAGLPPISGGEAGLP